MRAVILAVLLGACCRAQPRQPVRIERVDRACLTEAPDPAGAWSFAAGGEDGCPESFAACFPDDQAAALVVEVAALRAYAARAWALCGTEGGTP